MNSQDLLNQSQVNRAGEGAPWRYRLAGLVLTLLLMPAHALAEGSVEEVRPLAADGQVLVENAFGEIVILGWDREEVRITGYLSDDVKELEIKESGNSIRIRVDYYDRRSIDGAQLELMVPEGASVEAESVSGDLEAQGLSGETLELTTVSGDIDAAATVRRLSLNSVSGDLEFSGSASGRVDVETVSGEIELSSVSGEIEASTVSGDVTLRGDMLSTGEFESVSGDVEITAGLEDGGRINVSSMSGDIDLYLPREQEAEFYAQTFSGDIDSDFGRVRDSDRGPGSRLDHQEGNNGASINLNSFSGDVSIYRD